MQTQKFVLLCFLLSFLPCSACSANTPSANAPTPKTSVEPVPPTDLSIFPTPQPTPIEPVNRDGVWNTDTVDTTRVNPNKKLIAFTFDDAPSKTLEQIVAVFATFNETHPDAPASATVFCNGKRIDSHNLPLLHGACALGFEMGNHGYSHSDITTLTSEKLQTEIAKTDELLSVVDGKKTHLFRAPYGHINERVKKEIRVPIVDWTIDTLDWTNTPAKAIYSTIWEGRFSGAIALMHDGYPHTVDALKALLPALYEDGYQVVSVSQMAKAHGCTLRAGGVYIRARKH